MQKNWGSGLKASIEQAEKLKIEMNCFKGYEKACKNLDQLEKISNLLAPAVKDVEKFIAEPDPLATRDIGQFFKYKDEYVSLAKETFRTCDYDLLLNVTDLMKEQEKAKNKNGAAVCKSIKDCVQFLLFVLDPSKGSIFFKDTNTFKKEAKKNHEERVKEAAEKLAAKQERERKALETQGVTDWQAIYAALDGK